MKFFENKPKKTQATHLSYLTKQIIQENRVILNKILFNSLIILFWNISLPICEMIYALEHTLDTDNEESIRKILAFYKHYLEDRKNKYKGLVGSRYIVIQYNFDKNNKRNNEEWLDFVKGRVKFLRVQASIDVVSKIPVRLDIELCNKLKNTRLVDDIYTKIIDFIQKEKEEKIEKIIEKRTSTPKTETSMELSKENIKSHLLKIQFYINKHKDEFDEMEAYEIFNVIKGIEGIMSDLI